MVVERTRKEEVTVLVTARYAHVGVADTTLAVELANVVVGLACNLLTPRGVSEVVVAFAKVVTFGVAKSLVVTMAVSVLALREVGYPRGDVFGRELYLSLW